MNTSQPAFFGASLGVCFPPFIATTDPNHQVPMFPGCGLSCRDDSIWYSDGEYEALRRTIITLACLSLIFTTFTLLSCLIDRRQRQFPAVLLLNINICLFASSIAWIWTYTEGDGIICNADQTLKLNAPREVGDFKCVLSFIVIFYFTVAAHVWFVLLAIAWNFAFLQLGKPKSSSPSSTRKMLVMHHLIAWSLPALLTGAAVGSMQLDGLWLGQICHLSLIRRDNFARLLLLVVPEGSTVLLGGIFLARGAFHLERLRRERNNSTFLGGQSNQIIKETIIKIGLFCFLLLVFHLINVGVHITENVKKDEWIDGFESFISCRGREVALALAIRSPNLQSVIAGNNTACTHIAKPNLAVVYLGFFAQVALGIAMGLWGFNRHSFSKWKEVFGKLYVKLLTYHGEINLHKERRASAAESSSGLRRSDRSIGRGPRPVSNPVSMQELEMYTNPLAELRNPVNVSPPSPVSPVNIHANPISYHGHRVSVTTQPKSSTLQGCHAQSGRLSPKINPYSTWHGQEGPYSNVENSDTGDADWRPTPPKRDKSNRNVTLIAHRKADDTKPPHHTRTASREQMSLPSSIVGTGRYFLQAADFNGDIESAQNALFHGQPLSEKDKKRAVVVIEMSEDQV